MYLLLDRQQQVTTRALEQAEGTRFGLSSHAMSPFSSLFFVTFPWTGYQLANNLLIYTYLINSSVNVCGPISFITIFNITHINKFDKIHPWDILEVDSVFYNLLPPNNKRIIGENECFWELHMHTRTSEAR